MSKYSDTHTNTQQSNLQKRHEDGTTQIIEDQNGKVEFLQGRDNRKVDKYMFVQMELDNKVSK